MGVERCGHADVGHQQSYPHPLRVTNRACRAESGGRTERPPERPTALRQVETAGMEIGPAAGEPGRRAVDDQVAHTHEADEVGLVAPGAACNTGPLRIHALQPSPQQTASRPTGG